MISVLNEYDKFLQYVTHPIVEWQRNKRRLIYHKNLKTTLLWRFNVLFLVSLHCISGIFLLFLVLHGSAEVSPLPVLMVHVIFLFSWLFNLSIGVAIWLHGEPFVDGWNALFCEFGKLNAIGKIFWRRIISFARPSSHFYRSAKILKTFWNLCMSLVIHT